MKTKIISLIVLTAVFVSTGCGSSQSDPIKVAEKFANAWYNIDYDTCNDLSYKAEFDYEKDMDAMSLAFLKEARKEAKKKKYVIKVNKEETEIKDKEDRAYVEFNITDKDDFSYDGTVVLDKEDDGKWLVSKYSLKHSK